MVVAWEGNLAERYVREKWLRCCPRLRTFGGDVGEEKELERFTPVHLKRVQKVQKSTIEDEGIA
jgi:hypothetical protein